MRFVPLSLLLGFCASTVAQEQGDPRSTLLQVTRYAATLKASFRVGCKSGHALSTTPAYLVICPKLDRIPDSDIESTSLPCLKKYVPEGVASKGVIFWSSASGLQLSLKLVREIESGVNDQLSEEDLRLLDKANQSDFGQALSAFATDRECSAAVARAMLRYEP